MFLLGADAAKEVGEAAAMVGGGVTFGALVTRYGPPILRAIIGAKPSNGSGSRETPTVVVNQPAPTSGSYPVPSPICLEHAERLTSLEAKAKETTEKLDHLQTSVQDLPGQVVEAIKKANGAK